MRPKQSTARIASRALGRVRRNAVLVDGIRATESIREVRQRIERGRARLLILKTGGADEALEAIVGDAVGAESQDSTPHGVSP